MIQAKRLALKPLSNIYRRLSLLIIIVMLGLTACGDNPTPSASLSSPTTAAATATAAAVTTTAPVLTQAAPTTLVPTASQLPTVTSKPLATPTASSSPLPAASATALTQPTRPDPAAAQAIRNTNWLESLKKDPALSNYAPTDSGYKLGVTVKANKDVGGLPLFDQITYLDIDGDGVEEAIITLFSGGTAGNVGFLVYKQATPAPKLVGFQDGYKLGVRVQQGKLVIVRAFYSGWEANCCPSGITLTTYVLKNGSLQVLDKTSEGDSQFVDLTVSHFYDLLNERKFEEAYKLLSPAYKKANPYADWSAGFNYTRKIVAEATADPATSNLVRVKLVSTDSNAVGGETVRTFSGSWKLGWQPEVGWLMGEPDIKEITAPDAKSTVIALFQPLYKDLKSKAKIPLLLPTYFGEVDPKLRAYASTVKASATDYTLEISYTPDCNYAGACHIGEFSAESAVNLSESRGKPVKLANNLTGLFTEASCGASCGDATLSWIQNQVRYTVSYKAGQLETLTKIASSAILNGPL